jgi:hypothetical protein
VRATVGDIVARTLTHVFHNRSRSAVVNACSSLIRSSRRYSPTCTISTTPVDFISPPAIWYFSYGNIIHCASVTSRSLRARLLRSTSSVGKNQESRLTALPVSTQVLSSLRTSTSERPGGKTIKKWYRGRFTKFVEECVWHKYSVSCHCARKYIAIQSIRVAKSSARLSLILQLYSKWS